MDIDMPLLTEAGQLCIGICGFLATKKTADILSHRAPKYLRQFEAIRKPGMHSESHSIYYFRQKPSCNETQSRSLEQKHT